MRQSAPVIYATQSSVINCTWPCFDNNAKCVVTPKSASCQIPLGDGWILGSPTKAPTFTGASVSKILSACIAAPNPQLPAASPNTNINSNQTIVQWPPWTLRRPLDSYMGNCGHNLYCSSTGQDANQPVCRKRLSVGSMCYSSNQCRAGFCNDGVCHSKDEDSTGTDYSHSRNNAHMSNKTIQILASVLGIIGALLFACISFYMYHRHRRVVNKNHDRVCSSSGENTNSSSNFPDKSVVPVSSNSYNEEQFASDFLRGDTHHNAAASVIVDTNNALSAAGLNQLQADMLKSYSADSNGFLGPPPSYRQ
ncbi:hypothetical protein BD408DRAFT_90248 [Parasitella parasitica]|nr:hypothetical protein BD408DRAFT_90248 [Parasitella parasitica]